ncbi:MAG TPA: shikimate kinase [Candidatus Omnitrophica bacterium]|nr:shikimate kinase [Candidatus Omnitrophota bacterium]HCI45130.1 shikimate kinase [Candidatus Omnitrophota bacterium]
MSRKNIVLIGFMGSGKSLTARRLAQLLKRKSVSIDELIEAREGRPIKQIFAESGESYFRDKEQEVVREVAGEDGLVIDCGGGVVLNPHNITRLKANGIIIHLNVSAQWAYERVKNKGTRPLLNVEPPKERIRELLKERQPLYAQAADMTLETDGKTVEEVAKEIVFHLGHD